MVIIIVIFPLPIDDSSLVLSKIETSHNVLGIWYFTGNRHTFHIRVISNAFHLDGAWNSIHKSIKFFFLILTTARNFLFPFDHFSSECYSFALKKHTWLSTGRTHYFFVPIGVVRCCISTRPRQFLPSICFFPKITFFFLFATHREASIINSYYFLSGFLNYVSWNTRS